MTEVAKVDEKGRILIPKTLREKIEVREGDYVMMTTKEKSITIESLKPIADKYFGAFKVDKWPDDLDEFIFEVFKRWWKSKHT